MSFKSDTLAMEVICIFLLQDVLNTYSGVTHSNTCGWDRNLQQQNDLINKHSVNASMNCFSCPRRGVFSNGTPRMENFNCQQQRSPCTHLVERAYHGHKGPEGSVTP